MKPKKLIKGTILFAFILFSSLLFKFIFPGETALKTSPTAPATDKFYYGAILSYWDQPDYANYDAIGLNLTHAYIDTEVGFFPGNPNRHTPSDWIYTNEQENHLFTPCSTYAGDLEDAKANMNEHGQSRFLYQRPKIEWLAFGQSSIYEAEYIDPQSDLWFYSFNTHSGISEPDNQYGGGHMVLHCSEPANGPNAGYVLKYLKANTEQCKRSEGSGAESQWRCDSECDWFAKPRVRAENK